MVTKINGNGDEYTPGNCCECRGGEHDDYDDDIKMVKIIDPDNGKVIKRGKMCSEHRTMYNYDGYKIVY